jgi:acyl-CoA thioester hydrolase
MYTTGEDTLMIKLLQKNRNDYKYFEKFTTRWRDNDVYGHMNNVVFYEFVDSIVNNWLNVSGGLKVPDSKVIGLVVETKCTYFSPLKFPEIVNCGLVLDRKGNTSVSYEIGLFNEDQFKTSAQVKFVHVYVDSHTRKPIQLPNSLEHVLNNITLL